MPDSARARGDACRRCGSTPRQWEHLNDGLCPECYWQEIKNV